MAQMKKQDKIPEEQLSEVELGNLPGKDFRVRIITMIQDLGKRMVQEVARNFNQKLEN